MLIGDALDGQRRILRAGLVRRTAGVEMGTEGDSFFVVFSTAPAAVWRPQCRRSAQLAAFDWPQGEQVRVRMGIHTGSPTRARRRLRRHGRAPGCANRCCRSRRSGADVGGHGGPAATRCRTASALRDLGAHRLKDIAAPTGSSSSSSTGCQSTSRP